MVIEWLAGNRIRGTSAEKPALGLPSGSVGGWKEVGRTTLGSAGDAVNVTGLADKRYYMILANIINSGNAQNRFRVNNDSGSNYANRYSTNGGTDYAPTGETYFASNPHQGSFKFSQLYLSNLASKEKLFHHHSAATDGAGASNTPKRIEGVAKWANTSDAVDEFNMFNTASGDYASGAEVVVLGWDPADTHTTNFWEELASVELGAPASEISSGTITAKKYLWLQVYIIASGSVNNKIRFNNDTASNYAFRYSGNGATDATEASQDNINVSYNTSATNKFLNYFIINNSATEKILNGTTVSQNTAGAGNATDRVQAVGKWANTSAQITEIDVFEGGTGSFDTGTIMKVWGSD